MRGPGGAGSRAGSGLTHHPSTRKTLGARPGNFRGLWRRGRLGWLLAPAARPKEKASARGASSKGPAEVKCRSWLEFATLAGRGLAGDTPH
jgi:hypothetical protein